MDSFWKHQRVFITGGAGFLGSHLVEKIRDKNCPHIFAPRSSEFDLRLLEDVKHAISLFRPTLIIHAAAASGGIKANLNNPAGFFYDNAIMGIFLQKIACEHKVRKFVQVGSVCSYPKFTSSPFKETDLWNGYPEESNAPYGLAKKMLLVQGQALHAQYAFNSIHLLLTNLYGPKDNFDLQTSHTIPALIRKCLEAKKLKSSYVEVWGTGSASREFLYVEDAAEAIISAAEKYDSPDPINIGNGKEIKISELVPLIFKLCGFKGSIRWNLSMPDGQPRRCLDISKAKKEFGFLAKTNLKVGLKRTIEWYKNAEETK